MLSSKFSTYLLGISALVVNSLQDQAASSNTFDYIVVGGGTTGLVIANRLTENPNISVLVVEAGGSVLNNAQVYSTSGYGEALGTSIDWNFQTAPQTFAGNGQQTLHAGKAIGGTSTINGMAYTRAQSVQIDAWGQLGNDGWNWNTLFPYYLKSESYEIPDAAMQNAGASYVSSYHGYSGPLKNGYVYDMANDSLPHVFNSTVQNLGVPFNKDVNGGNLRGYMVYPRTVDTVQNVRADAARAYYIPVMSRSNLHMQANTTVTKILWASSSGSNATASGVQAVTASGSTVTYTANKEVIIAAGSLKTPQILELSGVGNPSILSKYNIPVKVSLPSVGENLQDQINNGLTYSGNAKTAYTGQRGYAVYPNVTDVFGSSTSSVASSVKSAIPAHASAVAAQSNNASTAQELQNVFTIQYDLLFESKVPVAEVIFYPSGTALSSQYWGLLPFARGNVHINSANPATPPTINPNYWMLGWDQEAQVGTAKWVRKLFGTAPVSSLVTKESSPGTSKVPTGASDSTWAAWLKSQYRPNYHTIGSMAMRPRASGGAVSNRLVVYGTSNVRVVDASIWPTQLCGHLTSTLYAVAERAADFIKQDNP